VSVSTDPSQPRLSDDEVIADLAASQVEAPSAALPRIQAAVASARAQERPVVLAHALCHLARNLGLSGQQAAAEAAATEAQQLFVALHDTGGTVMALNAMAMLLLTRGDYARALDHLSQALPLARRAGDQGRLGGVLNSLGNALAELGDLAAAAAAFEEAIGLLDRKLEGFRRAALRTNLAAVLSRLAQADRDAGKPPSQWMPLAQRAVSLAQDSLAAQPEAGSQAAMSALDALAQGLIVVGEPQRALSLLDQASTLEAERQSAFNAVHLTHTRAQALGALSRWDDAVAACESGLARAQEAGSEHHTDFLYLSLSTLHEQRGDWRAALQAHRAFHAVRARLVFARAERSARAVVSQLDLERAVLESRIDVLTGLGNRRAFDEHLLSVLGQVRGGSPWTLLLLDLDHLKRVNDRHGHPAGDDLLRRLATVLRQVIRGSEPAMRLGGDEFAVLIEGALPQAQALADRLRGALAAEVLPSGGAPTVSIGLAAAHEADTPEELVSRADRALYAVKRRGRDGVAAA
jgi:diguanylate cyclase (GGDEF)-like protein